MDLVSQNVFLGGCAAGWTYSNHTGLCYKYQSTKMPWTEARVHCQDLSAGGDLASVPDQAANDFLTTLTTEPSWIGATDEGSEGSWRWSDGSAWGYQNWSPGNPDNFNSNQHHALINWGGLGLWDDEDDNWSYPFICQSTLGHKDYAEQQLLDCATEDGGCHGAWLDHYTKWMTNTRPKPKLTSERKYPYIEMYNGGDPNAPEDPQQCRDASLLQGK